MRIRTMIALVSLIAVLALLSQKRDAQQDGRFEPVCPPDHVARDDAEPFGLVRAVETVEESVPPGTIESAPGWELTAARDAASLLRDKIERLDERIESMDKTQRRIIRGLIVIASVSTGLDAITWLKGDIV